MRQLLVAREEVRREGEAAWQSFVKKVDAQCGGSMKEVVRVMATLDALLSLASVASRPGWVRPTFVEEEEEEEGGKEGEKEGKTPLKIVIKDARHPVLEHLLLSSSSSSSSSPPPSFVPNDITLGVGLDAPETCLVVTGPNMGGKSTYIRTVALCQLLGQVGSYLPASSASLPILTG